ncbi:MAG: 50S ribosomal protein L20 [Fibromonadaceae bacterium]|jgi:large subunit ribosomal protein L20|nr:50S ribosomal protein L20 [Fibromonadaceae bacterium]
MSRAKTRVPSRERRKEILKAAKGYYGRRKSNLRLAIEATTRAGQYAYTHRRDRKGDFRSLWITRLNAAVREHGLKYSEFIHLLSVAQIDLNRKILADLAITDPAAFAKVVEVAKQFKN